MDVYGLYFVEASNGHLHLVVMVSPIGNRFTMLVFVLTAERKGSPEFACLLLLSQHR